MVSPLTLLLCIVCGVVPLGPSRTAPMASKGLSGHVLMCAGAMGSLHAPPALCAAIGSFLAAGGGWLSPSSVVVELQVHDENQEARRYYRRLGMRVTRGWSRPPGP